MSLRTPALCVTPPVAWPGRDAFGQIRGRGWTRLLRQPGLGLAAMAAWALGGNRRTRAETATAKATGQGTLSRFEAIVLPHLDAAYTLAVYLCRDRDAAEDVVQDAFLRAFRGFDGFRGDNARAWLLAIVRNCHLSWREELRRRAAVVDENTGSRSPHDGESWADAAEAPAHEDDPEAVLVRQGEAQDVRAVLADLPEAAREILVLRDVEDLSYRDIAQVLDIPLGTVMSRLARARKAFASRWRVRHPDGDAA